jgi:hypothetical protein
MWHANLEPHGPPDDLSDYTRERWYEVKPWSNGRLKCGGGVHRHILSDVLHNHSSLVEAQRRLNFVKFLSMDELKRAHCTDYQMWAAPVFLGNLKTAEQCNRHRVDTKRRELVAEMDLHVDTLFGCNTGGNHCSGRIAYGRQLHRGRIDPGATAALRVQIRHIDEFCKALSDAGVHEECAKRCVQCLERPRVGNNVSNESTCVHIISGNVCSVECHAALGSGHTAYTRGSGDGETAYTRDLGAKWGRSVRVRQSSPEHENQCARFWAGPVSTDQRERMAGRYGDVTTDEHGQVWRREDDDVTTDEHEREHEQVWTHLEGSVVMEDAVEKDAIRAQEEAERLVKLYKYHAAYPNRGGNVTCPFDKHVSSTYRHQHVAVARNHALKRRRR